LGTDQDPISKARDVLMTQMKKGTKYREELPFSLLPAEAPESKKQGYIVSIVEITDVMDAKPHACDLFLETAEKSGVAAAEAEFNALRQNNPKGYTFFEWDTNQAGYKALRAKKTDVAIALFTLNAALYPNSANVYDSLADGYAEKGDKEKAKANYQKAFQMNPKFTASKEKMEKL
jgi:tetratricopeptide (TPR) repeat protein